MTQPEHEGLRMTDVSCITIGCEKPSSARKMCTACYARWRRNRPGRCRYCGGGLGDEPVQGATHERCLRNRRAIWHRYTDMVIDGYGGRCTCCGETNRLFLTIDHVDGKGAEHRRQLGYGNRRLLLQIIGSAFPPEFTILCFNCNSGRARNGGVCPHVDTSDERRGGSRLYDRAVMG